MSAFGGKQTYTKIGDIISLNVRHRIQDMNKSTGISNHFRHESKLNLSLPIVIIFIGFLAAILAPKAIRFFNIDKCLDNGGSYDYENNVCMYGPGLNDINLSDEKVSGMSREELWLLGVKYLGWPEDLPSDLSKEVIHQKLLDAKYAKVVDHQGYSGVIGPKELIEPTKSR